MIIRYTYEKCGRGDRAKGHTRTVEVQSLYELFDDIAKESTQFLMSRDIDAYGHSNKGDRSGMFFVTARMRDVGSGTWEVLDEQA